MATLIDLGQAIAKHPNKVKSILLGFDLWLEVFTSGKVTTALFKKGGIPTSEDDPYKGAKIPLMVVGDNMVLGLDMSLPPDGFRLTP